MVFCGKPSKACYECRVRRIKCDQKMHGCTQCSRVNKLCSSYRDSQAVTIRDESQNVARRARARLEWEKEATGKREHSKVTSSSNETLSLDVLKRLEGGSQSTKPSLDHLNGAASLVSLRGSQNFENKGGLRKILRICFSMFMRYIQNHEPDPSPIIDWERFNGSFRHDIEFPACALAYTLFKFVSLRASIRKKELEEPLVILHELFLIESDLAEWLENLPSGWDFTTSDTSESSGTGFGGQLHSYRDIWISRIWSHYRWTRIRVHESIQYHLAELPIRVALTFANRRVQSVTILRQMAKDICISVPFHLCHYNTQPDKTLPRPEIIGAFDLLWPLTVVASSEHVSEDVHIWVMNVLESIGRTMGIKQAFVMISSVKSQREKRKFNAGPP